MQISDKFTIHFEIDSLRFPHGNLTTDLGSPDQFPIDLERSSLRFPYGNWPRATQANFPLILQGYLKESLWNFSLILRRIPQGFHMEFPIDLKGTP